MIIDLSAYREKKRPVRSQPSNLVYVRSLARARIYHTHKDCAHLGDVYLEFPLEQVQEVCSGIVKCRFCERRDK